MHALDLVCFEPVFRFSRGAMRAFAEAPGAVTMLAEAQGKLAGFCIAQLEDRTGYVVTLDVAPEWRRRGLARRLMADIESRLHAAGAEEMHLHVFSGNTAAIRFYEAIGYAQSGVVENFYAQNLHALLYRKKLPA
jgi:[ribosomal protein S18]-alanine N-acetyltransferase